MKKSKFLLLGSVASLASIPFVAAKCGETKEEKKLEARQTRSKYTSWTQIKVHQLTQDKVHQLTQIKVHQLTQDQGTPTNPGSRYTS